VEEFLDRLPARYLTTVDIPDILEHQKMMWDLQALLDEETRLRPRSDGLGLAVIKQERQDVGWKVTLAARHDPGLYPAVAGVMALNGINIMSSDLYLWRDKSVVLVLYVSDPPDALFVDEAWERVQRDIRAAMTGKLYLDYRLSEKRNSPLFRAPLGALGKPASVRVNNLASELYTLIEIEADDRLGLLYDIAETLRGLRLEVHLAKADTMGGRIKDVFYVRGSGGGKVLDPDQTGEIQRALTYRLGRYRLGKH
jgi:[protein-PII] uridylyltransferase